MGTAPRIAPSRLVVLVYTNTHTHSTHIYTGGRTARDRRGYIISPQYSEPNSAVITCNIIMAKIPHQSHV